MRTGWMRGAEDRMGRRTGWGGGQDGEDGQDGFELSGADGRGGK